jgi:replicative DNA helicase
MNSKYHHFQNLFPEQQQDADVVMFIYKDDDSEDLLDTSKRLMKIDVAKHRNGSTGEIDLMFRGDRVKFYDVAGSGISL